ELAIRRGDTAAGVGMLRAQLEKLHSARYELFTVRFQIVLTDGLAACGRLAEALSLAEETRRLIEVSGYTSYLPELLRLRGSILLRLPEPATAEAEACLLASLEHGRAQGARAWELR